MVKLPEAGEPEKEEIADEPAVATPSMKRVKASLEREERSEVRVFPVKVRGIETKEVPEESVY